MNSTPNPAGQIYNWFAKAVPEPAQKNKDTQLGVHFEEIAEMLQILMKTAPNGGVGSAFEHIAVAHAGILSLAEALKCGGISFAEDFSGIDMLDALADQMVTAIGVGYMYGYDVVGGLGEVADSNDSKFENGEPIFNENMKIMKGYNYFRPDLAQYV